MSLLQDIRLALRLFWRTPCVSVIVLISIAFSLSATAVIFTAIKSVLIDPLPYAKAEKLAQIGTTFGDFDPVHADFADFVERRSGDHATDPRRPGVASAPTCLL